MTEENLATGDVAAEAPALEAGDQNQQTETTEESSNEAQDQNVDAGKDDSGDDTQDLVTGDADEGEGEKKPEDDSEDGETDKEDEDQDGDKEQHQVIFDDLEIPEEMDVPESIRDEMLELAKNQNWTQEQTQDAVNLHVKVQQQQLENWIDMKKGWVDECRNDPNIGGDQLEPSIKIVDNTVRNMLLDPTDQFKDNPNFIKLDGDEYSSMQSDLKTLGIGSKSWFIKLMRNVGNVTGNDSQEGAGKSHASGGDLNPAEILYGKDGQGR